MGCESAKTIVLEPNVPFKFTTKGNVLLYVANNGYQAASLVLFSGWGTPEAIMLDKWVGGIAPFVAIGNGNEPGYVYCYREGSSCYFKSTCGGPTTIVYRILSYWV